MSKAKISNFEEAFFEILKAKNETISNVVRDLYDQKENDKISQLSSKLVKSLETLLNKNAESLRDVVTSRTELEDVRTGGDYAIAAALRYFNPKIHQTRESLGKKILLIMKLGLFDKYAEKDSGLENTLDEIDSSWMWESALSYVAYKYARRDLDITNMDEVVSIMARAFIPSSLINVSICLFTPEEIIAVGTDTISNIIGTAAKNLQNDSQDALNNFEFFIDLMAKSHAEEQITKFLVNVVKKESKKKKPKKLQSKAFIKAMNSSLKKVKILPPALRNERLEELESKINARISSLILTGERYGITKDEKKLITTAS